MEWIIFGTTLIFAISGHWAWQDWRLARRTAPRWKSPGEWAAYHVAAYPAAKKQKAVVPADCQLVIEPKMETLNSMVLRSQEAAHLKFMEMVRHCYFCDARESAAARMAGRN